MDSVSKQRLRWWLALAGVLVAFILYWIGAHAVTGPGWYYALPYFGFGIWLHYMSLRSV